MTLKTKGRVPPDLGPKVHVESVRAGPGAVEPGLERLTGSRGLSDTDNDRLLEHSAAADDMWLGKHSEDQWLEFEFAEPVAIGAIQVWNYNADWQTTNGIASADISVLSENGAWEKVLTDARFTEAEGTSDYDEPTVLKLKNQFTRKVRFDHIVPLSKSGKAGLSKVVFREPPGDRVTAVR